MALLALIHLGHGLLRTADPDEFQTLTNAFDASRGLIPYTMFWDNHGPLMIWILQPLLYLWTGGHQLIYVLRVLAWLNTVTVAFCVFRLTRKLHPDTFTAPFVSCVFLLGAAPFLSSSVEIRPDNIVTLLQTVALWSIIVAVEIPPARATVLSRRVLLLFVAGACAGLMVGFTIKSVFSITALLLFYIVWHLWEKRKPVLMDLLAALLGAAIPVAIIVSVLYHLGALKSFFWCYFAGNTARPFPGYTSSEFTEIYQTASVWAILATAIVLFTMWQIARGKSRGTECGLLVMVLSSVSVFLLLLPTRHMQSLLPLYVPLALLAGYAVEGLRLPVTLSRDPKSLAMVVMIPALLLLDMGRYSSLENQGLPKQVRFANETLLRTKHEQFVFDPSGIVFLKPKPGPFHVLVTYLRQLHQDGIIDLHLQDMLQEYDVRTLVFDRRTEDLRASDLDFITSHYNPVLKGPHCYLLSRDDNDKTGPNPQTPHPLQAWAARARHHTTTPAREENPPVWYTQYLRLYKAASLTAPKRI